MAKPHKEETVQKGKAKRKNSEIQCVNNQDQQKMKRTKVTN